MPLILKNDDAEALLLDIRTAGNAAGQGIEEGGGAFLLFPTSVVVARMDGGQLVFPLTVDIEPGTVVRADGTSSVSGVVDGVSVTGGFSWMVREGTGTAASPAEYRFRRRGRDIAAPAWAACLPASRSLLPEPPLALGRQRRRLLRQGRAAEYWLLKLTERVLRQSCLGPIRRAINHRPQVDVDDIVQRGMQVACRLLPVYASPKRPPCSWLGMLRLDGKRDMHREISRFDWLPPDAAAVVALAEAAGIALDPDPTATLAALLDAAARAGLALPRIGPRQVRAALSAPSLSALESLPPAYVEARVARTVPEFESVEDEWGRAAAAVARLVSDDPALAALAGEGDAAALSRIGAHVLDALRTGRESATATRRRCWTDFQSSGRLFDRDDSRQRFGSKTAEISLAAVDESLRQAAGIGGHPAAAAG